MDELSPSNGRWFQYHGTKESFVPSVHLEVWQDGGFTKVTRVIRHKTRKAILRVMTSTGVVDCTEDHSLLTKEGLKVSPNATNIGDQLLHYNDQDLHAEWQHVMLKSKSKYTKHQAFERGVYENDIDHDLLCGPLENVEAFWEGMDVREDRFYTKKVAMGLCLLGKRLGLSFRFASYDETSDKFALLPYDGQNTGEVEHLWIVSQEYDAYVYDLQTQNHHFSVGPGNLVVHNTDSVMLKFPEISPETANQLATFIEKECTQAFVPPMRLEFENLFSTYLLENKKRYAGRVWPTNETVTKGLCNKRRDFPKIVQDGLSGILDILLQGGDDAPDRALVFVEEILQQIASNSVAIERLSITKELNKGIDKYKTPPPHLVVSQKMALRNPHDPPKSGDRITFVVMNGRGNISERVEEYDYIREQPTSTNAKLDLAYYAEQLVSQCKNMMTLCGKKNKFERLATNYINIAKLFCNNQKKLSVFFQPTSSVPSVPPETTTKSKKRDLPMPKKQQQATLKKFFMQKK
jgi:hypothetical protein